MPQVNVDALALCVKNGEPGCDKAFAQLIEALRGIMHNKYSSFIDNGMPSADFATMFTEAVDNALLCYDPQWRFTTWAARNMEYVCREAWRRRRKEEVTEAALRLKQGMLGDQFSGASPLDHMIAKDERAHLQAALKRESRVSRKLVLVWMEGFPPLRDAARALGKTYDGARQIQHRNIMSLREALTKNT